MRNRHLSFRGKPPIGVPKMGVLTTIPIEDRSEYNKALDDEHILHDFICADPDYKQINVLIPRSYMSSEEARQTTLQRVINRVLTNKNDNDA